MFIYDAAMKYIAEGTPTVIFAGEEYGTGSSRDWAAKGTQLLGIKAVVARSFERIHRSNLVGMGVLPLQFKGRHLAVAGPHRRRRSTIVIPTPSSSRKATPSWSSRAPTARARKCTLTLRIDTPIEVDYYRTAASCPSCCRQLLPGSAGPRRFKLPIAVAELLIDGDAVTARIAELAL
jgi:aconitate hydratase